jgi:phosphosulfolactate synthase (CoM biosynthesis protein A)
MNAVVVHYKELALKGRNRPWFIKHLGPDVNLGNIPPDEVIPLETLRRGLRSDTLSLLLGLDG